MTPHPNAPPPQPQSWLSQNWKILAGVGCLVALLCCGAFGALMGLGAFAAAQAEELGAPLGDERAAVDCGSPGPGGVDCVLKRTGGSRSLRACWKLEITCANKGVMVGEGCGDLPANVAEETVTLPVSAFSNQAACDEPVRGAVKELEVKVFE